MHSSPSIHSHFNNIIHLIGNLPQGHEKPLKHALYNAIALFLLSICCAVGYALFLVLEPFFKPLLWALLVGCLLHPIKYSISMRIHTWFADLERSKKPMVFAVLITPINVINDLTKIIGATVHKYYKIFASALVLVFTLIWMYKYFPWRFFNVMMQFFLIINSFVNSILQICNTYIFITLIVGYIAAVYILWTPETENIFRKLSLFLWLLGSSYIAHLTGSFKAVTFILLQSLAVVGFLLEVYELYNSMKNKGCDLTIFKAVKWTATNRQNSTEFRKAMDEVNASNSVESHLKETPSRTKNDASSDSTNAFPVRARLAFQNRTVSCLPLSSPETKSAIENHIIAALHRRALSSDNKVNFNGMESLLSPNDNTDSSMCFKCLFWACTAMVLWKHPWIWPLILIALAIFIIKLLGTLFGIWTFLESHITDMKNNLLVWSSVRYSALLPAHVQGITKIINKLNKKLYETIKESVDLASSLIVISGLILFITCAPIFMGVQIYSEGITVIQLSSNLINRTIVHNPELRQMLPPGWDNTVDSLLDNAYLYGREGLSKTIKSILQDTDAEKSIKLEKQLLDLWDNIYQTWISDSDTNSKNNFGIQQTWESFMSDITKTPEVLNTGVLMDFAKQNVGTLLTLLDSLWSLLKGNITLMIGSVSAVTSVVLGGSTAVLNFILSLVVFFTTLFYLLNSSSALYKPIHIISSFSPINGSRFGLALTDAVNGVFKATLKMAVFYGLWTWLIHNLFGAKIVYLPSALAAIMAAIPFLGTYLACIPAVLDLWLAQGSPFLALLLAVCQFAPTSYVDTIIYKEIKNGGHPYFTGLAIAGGIFCLGPEGAIFGPLLLCCLLVALNLSTTLFTETPLEEATSSSALQNRLE